MTEARAFCEAAFKVDGQTGAAPAWVHLLPIGAIAARDGRRWKVSDPKAVVAATKATANGAPVAIDYDHQLINAKDNGQPAPAAGWMTDFEVRPDGVWASVEWTDKAAKMMIAAKQYRFISPFFSYTKETGEIGQIYHAGLTIFPAMTTLTALASAQEIMANDSDLSNQLRRLLKISDTATPDAIIEAVRGLQGQAAASAAPDQYVSVATLEAVTAELNRTKRGVSLDAANMAVEREIEGGRLIPALKTWAVDLCTVNKPAFDSFVERTAGNMQRLFEPSAAAAARVGSSEPDSDLKTEIARNLGHKTPTRKA